MCEKFEEKKCHDLSKRQTTFLLASMENFHTKIFYAKEI